MLRRDKDGKARRGMPGGLLRAQRVPAGIARRAIGRVFRPSPRRAFAPVARSAQMVRARSRGLAGDPRKPIEITGAGAARTAFVEGARPDRSPRDLSQRHRSPSWHAIYRANACCAHRAVSEGAVLLADGRGQSGAIPPLGELAHDSRNGAGGCSGASQPADCGPRIRGLTGLPTCPAAGARVPQSWPRPGARMVLCQYSHDECEFDGPARVRGLGSGQTVMAWTGGERLQPRVGKA